jgi:hypothetical protein
VRPTTALEQGMKGLCNIILLFCIVCAEERNLLGENKSTAIKKATEDLLDVRRFI